MIINEHRLAYEALNALSANIAVLDPTGTIIAVNDAWSRFAAANGGPARGDAYVGANYLGTCRDAVGTGDESAADALRGLEQVLFGDRDEFTMECPCHTADEQRWFRMTVTRFGSGLERRLVVAHKNITTEKRQQQALEAGERLLRTVLEALPIGVWILGPDGQITQANAAGIRIWGGARFVGPREFGQYKGWWFATGTPIAPDEWAAARAIQKGQTSIDEEVEIECFDGTRKIILNSAVPLRDADGRVTGAIIINQDITSRKHVELERELLLREHDRLRAAAEEATRMKDDFIATLSHELRTPLNAVLGWLAILKRVAPDARATARAAEAIERNARVQAALLNDTLDVSRIVRGKLQIEKSDVDLAALAAAVVESMQPAAAEKRIDLTMQARGEGAIVWGDPTRLQQVVWNLVVNALKFTPAGGRVDVSASGGDAFVELTVRDTGVGIAAEFLPLLFDKFQQGSGRSAPAHDGLGLGLSIVKELVDLHDGSIRAESGGLGQGATFILRLPRKRPHLSDTPL